MSLLAALGGAAIGSIGKKLFGVDTEVAPTPSGGGGFWDNLGSVATAAAPYAMGYASYRGGEMANETNIDQAQLNRDFQRQMSNTSYQRAVKDMRKAGLNPMLAYSQGGATTPSGSTAQVSDTITPAMNSGMRVAEGLAQIKQLSAQTQQTQSQTALNGALAKQALSQSSLNNNSAIKALADTRLINANVSKVIAETANIPSEGERIRAATHLLREQAKTQGWTRELLEAQERLVEAQILNEPKRGKLLEGQAKQANALGDAYGSISPFITNGTSAISNAVDVLGNLGGISDFAADLGSRFGSVMDTLGSWRK